MTRIRIIIPAATIERTKLYLIRGAALLLCVLIFPLAAHASPFDSGISSIQTLFTGTIAKAASLIAIVIGGYPPPEAVLIVPSGQDTTSCFSQM